MCGRFFVPYSEKGNRFQPVWLVKKGYVTKLTELTELTSGHFGQPKFDRFRLSVKIVAKILDTSGNPYYFYTVNSHMDKLKLLKAIAADRGYTTQTAHNWNRKLPSKIAKWIAGAVRLESYDHEGTTTYAACFMGECYRIPADLYGHLQTFQQLTASIAELKKGLN